MISSYGPIFKKIRKGKNMSLKDIAGDVLSVSFLSKFERGESDISLIRFLFLLENLNISIEEFYKLSTDDNPNENDVLIAKVSQAFYNNNLLALNKYKREELEKYEEIKHSKYLYNSIMIEAFISSINGQEISETSMKALTDYLFGIEYWGKYELMIFGNSMKALSFSVLTLLVDELTDRTRLFGSIDENFLAKIGILINAAYISVENDELFYAKKYLDQLSYMRIPERLLYERLEMNFVEGLYNIKTGKKKMGENQVEDSLKVLRIMGAEQLFIAREELYSRIIKSSI